MHHVLVTRHENIEAPLRYREQPAVAQCVPTFLYGRAHCLSDQQIGHRNRHVMVEQNVRAGRRDTPGSR